VCSGGRRPLSDRGLSLGRKEGRRVRNYLSSAVALTVYPTYGAILVAERAERVQKRWRKAVGELWEVEEWAWIV